MKCENFIFMKDRKTGNKKLPREGFEPPTFCSVGSRSVQLS